MKLAQGFLVMGMLLSACMAEGDAWLTGIKIAGACAALLFITVVAGHDRAA